MDEEQSENELADQKDATDLEDYLVDYVTGKFLLATEEEIRRQEIERRIVEDWGYPKELVSIESEVQFGSNRRGRADIVVFKDGFSKDINSNAYIIVEVKRDTRRDGLEQLESYVNATTAEFGIWYNGKDISLRRRLRRPHRFQEISRIPRYGETFKDLENQFTKDKLKPSHNLKSRFDEIHNYLYANEGFLKEKLFGEIIKLIFMKIVDEKSPMDVASFSITESEYESLLESGTSDPFKRRIESMWMETKRLYPEIDGELALKLLSMAEIIKRIQDVSLTQTREDVKGTAFQTFIHENMRGDRGEFFTPQPAIDIAVRMLDPTYEESIIDPACGTGKFLVTAMELIREKYQMSSRTLADYARAHIAGVDINSDLVKVAKMYMVLFDDGWSNIFSSNSLLSFDEIDKTATDLAVPKVVRPHESNFDIVLTNPPFGTKGRVNSSHILSQYEMAHKWQFDRGAKSWVKTDKLMKEQTPEILFIERCWKLLKPFGRMAIVLPDGILTNFSLGYVRQWLLDHTRILAVVSLPSETFVPFGTGTKASILLLQKLSVEAIKSLNEKGYDVFMSVPKTIGYDIRGRTIFRVDDTGSVVKDSSGNSIIESDVPDIIDEFTKFKNMSNLEF